MPIKGTESSQLRQAVVPGAEIFGPVSGLCNHGKGTTVIPPPPPQDIDTGAIGAVFDGGGFPLEVNSQGSIYVKAACTILSWTILFLVGVTDSVEFGIYRTTYANYESLTTTDSITGGNNPFVTSANKNQQNILTGWETTINAGDTLVFNCNSRGAPTWAVLVLSTQKL